MGFKKIILFTALVLFGHLGFVFGTHNRAGEITYCHDVGTTYWVTVTTYTKASSCAADRCELEINFGDGTIDTISRINGTSCPSGCGSCDNCGILVDSDTKKNIYTTKHTYPGGVGTYTISVVDPTRNEGVQNIPNSVDVSFYIESEIIIVAGLGFNCSPVLEYPPIDNGCVGTRYEHNPGAVDPDGDSLVFSLVPSKGQDGLPIPGYVMPNLTPSPCNSGSLNIDSQTGLLVWDYPVCQGEYNLAILIEEYRNGYKIGTILRDMQINIISPCPNNPPIIKPTETICVLAGDTIRDTIIATDEDAGQIITLSGSGEPLNLSFKPATFNQVDGPDSVYSELFWATDCQHIQKNDYLITFKAKDDHPIIKLVDYETVTIKVIAPAPDNLSISSQGNEITIDWDKASCDNATCYNIYRRIDSSGYVPDHCETGVPPSAGYQLVSTISGIDNHQFIDNDPSIVHGQKYCYIVTSCFSDGAESQASEEICLELKQDVPLITHVSIFNTDVSNGKDTIIWAKPTELDTITYPGPYQYKIYRAEGFGNPTNLIYTSPLYNLLYLSDTVFIDTLLNTQSSPYNYEIEIYYNSTEKVGVSDQASSVFLTSTPTDNALNLSWTEYVPWTNYMYFLFKKNDLGIFQLLDTVYNNSYSDTQLLNGKEYCYYVVSQGEYSLDGIQKPLINYSQIHCNIPKDDVPPCAANMSSIENKCEEFFTKFIWSKPDSSCADDVVRYYIYYSPQLGEEYTLLDSVNTSLDTSYTYQNYSSIAGCYKVTALDTFYNESAFSDSLCVDNCPIYSLPNVFSPGKDGYNDLFEPFPYRYIQSIELNIFNRWGDKVFSTTNPSILWDGKHARSGKPCTAGTYYYTCDVYSIKYAGIEKSTLQGYITLFPEDPNKPVSP